MTRIAGANPIEHGVLAERLDQLIHGVAEPVPLVERVLGRAREGRKHRSHGEVRESERVAHEISTPRDALGLCVEKLADACLALPARLL